MLTHVHPCIVSLPTGSSLSDIVRQLCPGQNVTARCPEPLRTASGITRLLQGRLAPFRRNDPPFFAHTDSCARPNPSRRLRLSPYTADLCRLLSVPAGRWPFPTLDLRVFAWMLGPVPRRFVRCTCSFLPSQHRPSPRNVNGSANHKIVRSATSERGPFSRALSFLTFWPPSLLATPVAPTAVVDGSLIRSHRRAAIDACGPGAYSGGAPPAFSTTGQPWRLHPSRTHVVAFMCIGYASRPIPSN